jgi:hypothetical protein
MRSARVLAELALRTPLAQEVPALIELLLDVPQALGVCSAAGTQFALLFDEGGYVLENLHVTHSSSLVCLRE